MTTAETAGRLTGVAPGILDKERTIAAAGFNRWLVPPAALCIHLCIGMAYGFSVFWLPLSRAIGLRAPKACPDITLAGNCSRRPATGKSRAARDAGANSGGKG